MNPAIFLFAIKILDLTLLAIESAPELLAGLRDDLALIPIMVKENRTPSPAEWSALDAKTAELSGRLQAVAAADRASDT
jgi:hypothetical protein